MSAKMIIRRFCDVRDRTEVVTSIDRIFFQSSNTQSFADDDVRAHFRERWLGRYLEHDPEWAYVALTEDMDVAGYLVGCVADPAKMPRFADIPLYSVFKELTERFPAHLHVNLAPEFRSAGIGTELVALFCADARQHGSPGVHVITSRDARNVGFYARNGFVEQGATGDGPRAAVFLGRAL